MGKLVGIVLVLVATAAVACGGGNKEPMVPDGPDMTLPDAGAPDPATSASAAPASTATPPAK